MLVMVAELEVIRMQSQQLSFRALLRKQENRKQLQQAQPPTQQAELQKYVST